MALRRADRRGDLEELVPQPSKFPEALASDEHIRRGRAGVDFNSYSANFTHGEKPVDQQDELLEIRPPWLPVCVPAFVFAPHFTAWPE